MFAMLMDELQESLNPDLHPLSPLLIVLLLACNLNHILSTLAHRTNHTMATITVPLAFLIAMSSALTKNSTQNFSILPTNSFFKNIQDGTMIGIHMFLLLGDTLHELNYLKFNLSSLV
jgi:hypothetical protein